jgi:CBS domain-containing protein
MKTRGSLISDTVFYTDQQSEMQYFQTLSYNNTPLRTTATIMVSEVAQLMAEMRVNSAVVCEANVPIGLLPIRISLKSLQVASNYCCSK